MAWRVDGEEVDERRITAEMDRLRPHYERAYPSHAPEERESRLREWSRENVIEQILIRNAALADPEEFPEGMVDRVYENLLKEAGSPQELVRRFRVGEGDEAEIRRRIEERLRIDRLIHGVVGAEEPTDEEVRRCYDEHKDEFMIPEMVRASHIVSHPSQRKTKEERLEEMKAIRKKLRNRQSFEEIAAKHSDCPDNGGDLGYFPRGQMVPEFEEAVWDLEIGETTDIFETEFGYHIAKLTDKKGPEPYPFKEVKNNLKQRMIEERRRKAMEEFVDSLRAKAVIEEKQ